MVFGEDFSTVHKIYGKNINWSLVPIYPNCQYLNLIDYLDSKTLTPIALWFFFGLDLELLFYLEDRRKVVGRTLVSNLLAYDGPILKINTSSRRETQAVFSLSQQILTDKDPNSECKTYPNNLYQSYKDCDKEFVSNYTKKLNITPFWATDDLESITEEL